MAAADSPFRPVSLRFPTGQRPVSVAVGELDGDHDADLAVVNQFDRTISILIGDGTGMFVSGPVLETGPEPRAIRMGDLDRDGHLDLVLVEFSASPPQSWASILLGNGDGSFRTRVDIPTPVYAASVDLGDVDGDGSLDLAVANTASSVSLLLGNGDGTFGARRDFAVGSNGSNAVRIVDVNADGRPDIVTANKSTSGTSSLSILQNLGAGTFANARLLVLEGIDPVAIAAGDLDEDGRVDLALADRESDTVSVLFDGTASFARRIAIPCGNFPRGVEIGDFDRDGHADLAVAVSGDVAVLLGAGGGRFRPPVSWPAGAKCASLASADIDGNGTADLVTADDAADLVSVLLGNGDGTFGGESQVDTEVPSTGLVAADVNGDGRIDFLVGEPEAAAIAVLEGDGSGRFAPPVAFPAGDGARLLRVADFDRDGVPDIAVLGTQGIAVLLGTGGGEFAAPVNLGVWAADFAIGDYDADGVPDLILSAGLIVSLRGRGDGTFEPPRRSETDFFGSTDIEAADFNSDGRVDVLIQGGGSPSWYQAFKVFLGHGDGSYEQTWWWPGYGAVGTTDLDADGVLDLVAGGGLFRGQGDGRFEGFAGLPGSGAVASGDFDADRQLDVAVADRSARSVSVRLGGTGEAFEIGTGPTPDDLATGDFNGDGAADLAIMQGSSRSITILRSYARRTPLFVEFLTASRLQGAVQVAWGFSAGALGSVRSVGVERAADPAGPFAPLGVPSWAPEARMSYRDPEPPAQPWYRLAIVRHDGTWIRVGPVGVDGPESIPARLVLRSVAEQRDGSVQISYAIPRRAMIDLVVFDVRGRRLWSSRGLRGEGEHREYWDRRDGDGVELPRGVYFVEARSDGAAASRKIVSTKR